MNTRRITLLEHAIGIGSDVRPLIGRFYDELTEDERRIWCGYYYGIADSHAFEDICAAIEISLHFKCGRKPKEPTKAEHKRNVAEVERMILEIESK